MAKGSFRRRGGSSSLTDRTDTVNQLVLRSSLLPPPPTPDHLARLLKRAHSKEAEQWELLDGNDSDAMIPMRRNGDTIATTSTAALRQAGRASVLSPSQPCILGLFGVDNSTSNGYGSMNSATGIAIPSVSAFSQVIKETCPTPQRVQSCFAAAGAKSELGAMLRFFSEAIVSLFTRGVDNDDVLSFPSEWDQRLHASVKLRESFLFELQGFSTLFLYIWGSLTMLERNVMNQHRNTSGAGQSSVSNSGLAAAMDDGVAKAVQLPWMTTQSSTDAEPVAQKRGTTHGSALPPSQPNTVSMLQSRNAGRTPKSKRGPTPSPCPPPNSEVAIVAAAPLTQSQLSQHQEANTTNLEVVANSSEMQMASQPKHLSGVSYRSAFSAPTSSDASLAIFPFTRAPSSQLPGARKSSLAGNSPSTGPSSAHQRSQSESRSFAAHCHALSKSARSRHEVSLPQLSMLPPDGLTPRTAVGGVVFSNRQPPLQALRVNGNVNARSIGAPECSSVSPGAERSSFAGVASSREGQVHSRSRLQSNGSVRAKGPLSVQEMMQQDRASYLREKLGVREIHNFAEEKDFSDYMKYLNRDVRTVLEELSDDDNT